jgi:hypothetical protein
MADLGVLLPVRIETRFKNGDLWVRVVPDEPWFLHDDPRITEEELLALGRYVVAPRDPGPDGVPGAWRSLAGQVGAPRAVFLHRRFVTSAPDGRLAVRTPDPQEMRTDPALPRVANFPAELVVWLRAATGTTKDVLRLRVDRARLLADFADPDVPGDRRWWEDWDEAVAVGLAGIVPASELGSPIDALIVTGLGDGDVAEHFSSLVAEGRVGLLEPGTPTNSVDGRATAPIGGDAASWWEMLQNPPRSGDLEVSRVLTGDASRLGNMPGGDRPQRTLASALISVLWPALWGFAAGEIHGLERGPVPARWAARALFPEGAFPTVRIGPQPYGLLPTTDWRSWQAAEGDPTLEAPLINALLRLRAGHVRAARARGTAAGKTTEGLLDVIADTPTSSQFRYRFAWPLELWWLSVRGSGLSPKWREFSEAWAARYRLADRLGLRPRRRYGARGVPRRVGIPLVVPRGTPPGAVAATLRALAGAAKRDPSSFANTAKLETDVLGLQGSSLLLRLAIRSLQLLIGEVQREREGIASPQLEPFSRNDRQRGPLEALIARATEIDTSQPTKTAQHLIDVAQAVAVLGKIPPPALERMLAATVDCATHRIDAWFVAPVQRRLDDLQQNGDTTRRLGAYGWVDNPAPGRPGPTTAGLLHAPSVPAALAAAVLRDRAVSESGGRWELDITSRSARTAERLAEHVRVGAHLAEALGREVERVVAQTEAIERLRRTFPVRTEHAGRRVCDGMRVLAQRPFPIPVDAAQEAALQELRDGLDAYGDLLVADAVHHLVEGRAEVAGAVMNGAAGLGRPPELSLLRTPREGRAVSTSLILALTHIAHQPLPDTDAERALLPASGTLDPSVAAFLAAQTGAASEWDFELSLTDGTLPARSRTVTLGDLGLDPADALALTRARLETMAVERAAEVDGMDVNAVGFRGIVTGGSAARRYEHAVRLVGLVGRNPAGARALSENPSAGDDPTDGIDARLLTRYLAAREVCAALVRSLHGQVELFGPGGEIGNADPAVLCRLAVACARWGVAPDPSHRPDDAVVRRLIERTVSSLSLLQQRLAASPDAAAIAPLTRDEFCDAAAALVSPTRHVALTGTTRSDGMPAVSRSEGERGVDATWLVAVAAVRPALARLEVHQLLADAPLRPWTNRAGDPWQTDSSDMRRMIAVYAAPQLDFAAMSETPVAVAIVDRFSEVIPAAELFTGAAFGFDAPASRAQQAILLAVPPVLANPLTQETLVRIVTETRDLAHARMARPVDLDEQFRGVVPTALLPASGAIAVNLEVRE